MKYSLIKVNVTPDFPVHMAGYARTQKSIGSSDDIEINTLALEINHKIIIYTYVDSIMVSESFVDSIRLNVKKMYAHLDLTVNIGAIHTHSAPAYFKLAFEDTIVEHKLTEELMIQVTQSICTSLESLKECTLEVKESTIDGLFGNRNDPSIPSDKTVSILEFYEGNTLSASLINIAVHPTVLNGSNFYLSSDLLGRVRKLYSEAVKVPCIIVNGAAGDVSTRFFRQHKDAIENLSSTASSVVTQMIEKSKRRPLRPITTCRETEVEYRSHSDFSHDAVVEKMLNSDKDDPMSLLFKDRCLKKIGFGQFDMRMQSNLVFFSNILILTLPGDVVSEFGFRIKNAFPNLKVFLFGYTNTYCNYLVNHEQYGLYFETYNSRLMDHEADIFINSVIEAGRKLVAD